MYAKGMKLWGLLVAVLVLIPLLAAAQVTYRESRQARNYDQARGPVQVINDWRDVVTVSICCLLYTSPSPRDRQKSRMPSSA